MFKSEAQRLKFEELRLTGKISEAEHEKWKRASEGKRLPERVGKPVRGEKGKG